MLNISRSAYYAYQSGESYQLTEGQEKLRTAMLDSFAEHRRRYGSRRLLAELQEQGHEVGRHQLRRLMQQAGLQAIQRQRPTVTEFYSPHNRQPP